MHKILSKQDRLPRRRRGRVPQHTQRDGMLFAVRGPQRSATGWCTSEHKLYVWAILIYNCSITAYYWIESESCVYIL